MPLALRNPCYSMLSRKPEDEFWGEEAGRRFVVQQEELVALREENAALRKEVGGQAPACRACVRGALCVPCCAASPVRCFFSCWSHASL
eukprot:354921-Chlamydomonas_euryale.AAC.16